MTTLDQYLFAMDAVTEETTTGDGLLVASLTASGSGTSGVTTPEGGLPLPTPEAAAEADWSPLGDCDLPHPTATGAQAAWRPAWGSEVLPLPVVTGQAAFALVVDALLPPLFYEAATGALGAPSLSVPTVIGASAARAALTWPLPTPYGLSALNRQGEMACPLPALESSAWSCGLDDPIANATDADTVVALLCQNDAALARAATALANGASPASVGADTLASTLRAAVAAQLAYVADTDGDVWTCALGTYGRGSGDCEDGAILLHGLLLAAGVASDRLVTVFGRVDVARTGHAWVTYRRESDGNWVVLDWTAGPDGTTVAALPAIDDDPYYALVDYALTAKAFFTVRQRAAQFFPKACHVALSLPEPELAGSAVLGGHAACALETGWLKATALAAATGRGQLPRPAATAQAGTNRLTVTISDWTLQGQAGARADRSSLATVTATGQALGTWGKTATLAMRPRLAATASIVELGEGEAALGHLRLSASGITGQLATGRTGWTRIRLAGHADSGRLGQGTLTLAAMALSGLGLATDPATGVVVWPPCRAAAGSLVTTTLLEPYQWLTASQELY